MNGACKVWNRVIVHTASAMLLAANLPISLWGQESLCAIYLLNRSPTKGLHLRCTPYEVLHGQKPYIGHICTWGCRAYAHIPKELRKKWDSHSRECLLMGFYDSENLFQLYDIAANSIIKVRDVIFFEDILGHDKFQQGCGRKLQPGMVITETQSPLGTTANADTVDIVTPDPTNDASIRNSLAVLVHSNEMAYLAFSATLPPPVAPTPLILNLKIAKSYKSAMQSPQASEWKKARDAEFEALQHNNTWSLVPRIPNMVVIQHKWVFDIKVQSSLNGPPIIDCFKARLVAHGDSQIHGINYDEVYAPVVRFVSLRIVLHVAAMLDLDIEQGDFCNVFLNGTLSDSDNIFMSQPEGYVLDPDLVCHLHKSLYGLKQGARQWYACLHECLTSFGMQHISSDQAI